MVGIHREKAAEYGWEMSEGNIKKKDWKTLCRWDKELLSGGSDPYYTDGQNMNLLETISLARSMI